MHAYESQLALKQSSIYRELQNDELRYVTSRKETGKAKTNTKNVRFTNKNKEKAGKLRKAEGVI